MNSKWGENYIRNSGQLPKVVCIGAQKAGTTWVHHCFGSHPQIWRPPFKELHFFDTKFLPECKNWTTWHVRKSVKRTMKRFLSRKQFDHETLDYLESLVTPPILNGTWYKHVFSIAPDDKIGMDVTPEYCCIPPEGVDFMASFLPDAKFIYLIRDPVERAISQLKMNIAHHQLDPKTKGDWLKVASEDVIAQRGDYASYIPTWENKFDPDRLLFVPFKEIEQHPRELLTKLEEFVGLKPYENYKDMNKKYNSSIDLSVPDHVPEFFRERFKVQSEFLFERFGDNFL